MSNLIECAEKFEVGLEHITSDQELAQNAYAQLNFIRFAREELGQADDMECLNLLQAHLVVLHPDLLDSMNKRGQEVEEEKRLSKASRL